MRQAIRLMPAPAREKPSAYVPFMYRACTARVSLERTLGRRSCAAPAWTRRSIQTACSQTYAKSPRPGAPSPRCGLEGCCMGSSANRRRRDDQRRGCADGVTTEGHTPIGGCSAAGQRVIRPTPPNLPSRIASWVGLGCRSKAARPSCSTKASAGDESSNSLRMSCHTRAAALKWWSCGSGGDCKASAPPAPHLERNVEGTHATIHIHPPRSDIGEYG